MPIEYHFNRICAGWHPVYSCRATHLLTYLLTYLLLTYLLTYLLNFISTKKILDCMHVLYFILGNVHNVQFFGRCNSSSILIIYAY